MSAFVRKCCIQRETWFGMDARLRCRFFKYSPEEAFGLGMGNHTGYLTLFASNTSLRMHKDSFHIASFLCALKTNH
jgi:hypothetical protein